MNTDLSILGAHNFGAQIKGLVNYCQWQKENYLWVMIIDRDEDICFYHFFIVYVHSKIPQVEEKVVFSRWVQLTG